VVVLANPPVWGAFVDGVWKGKAGMPSAKAMRTFDIVSGSEAASWLMKAREAALAAPKRETPDKSTNKPVVTTKTPELPATAPTKPKSEPKSTPTESDLVEKYGPAVVSILTRYPDFDLNELEEYLKIYG
jgi:hypothetical protein